jgi:Ring finger domain
MSAAAMRLAMRDGNFTGDDYAELLALDDNNHKGKNGLSKEQLAKLPLQTGPIKSTDSSNSSSSSSSGKGDSSSKSSSNSKEAVKEDCCICMEAMNGRHKVLVLSACKHQFHAVCGKKWLANSASCPICKEPVHADF